MSRRSLHSAAIVVLLVAAASGQTIAPYAGEFLSIGAGARSLAMGGAYTALATDATGSYWNPSALTGLPAPDVMLMHEERFAGLMNYDVVSGAMPFEDGSAIGFTVLRLGVDGIFDTRDALIDLNGNGELDPGERLDYSKVTSFSAADWALYGSYAGQLDLLEGLSYGVSVKLVRRDIAEFSAMGIGFDAGLLYRPMDEIVVGATFQDVTTTLIAWSTGRTELVSPTMRIGGAAFLVLGNFEITPSVECAIRAEGRKFSATMHLGPLSVDPYAGAEIRYKGTLSLRGGYSEVGHATIGAGLQFSRLFIDYAFTGFSQTNDLGSSHRVSLRLRIEQD